jgi:UDP-glucose:(heptosyl)LPS alpha-1,3-glucosyltransferase
MASTGCRIGFVRRGYSSTGGAERYLLRFVEALKRRGHSAALFTTHEWPESASTPFSSFHRLPDQGPTAFADALSREQPKKHCDVLFSLERVWECDFYRAGDGVHRAWLARRARSSSPLTRLFRAASRKHREILTLEAQLFAPSNPVRIIANSELVKHEIAQEYGKAPSAIHVIYNGYKRPAVQGDPRSRIRASQGLQPEDIMVLFVGSGWERKGLRYAIQATRLLSDFRVQLFVIGKGKSFGMPRGPVTYLGAISDVAPYYVAADLFLLPPLYDPFSNACLEASAHGLPVITSTSNGFSEVFVHGIHGEVVEDPTNATALAHALRLWLDPKKRQDARDLIRQNAQPLSVEANLEATLRVILS